jgi:hypothetical protein
MALLSVMQKDDSRLCLTQAEKSKNNNNRSNYAKPMESVTIVVTGEGCADLH